MPGPTSLTISQVNKAGTILRRWQRGDVDDTKMINRALEVVWLYRAVHARPLAKATMGLRSVVRTEGCPVEVSQRLKRMATVLDKLKREPTMQLGNMQDVGGCRALFDSIGELRRVEHRLMKNRPPLRYSDYIDRPRSSGYRAVHVIVSYEDEYHVGRAIEIQLRTKVMHEWAINVERLSGRLREDLKAGRGPVELVNLLAVISEAMAIEEVGDVVPASVLTRIVELRSQAGPYLR